MNKDANKTLFILLLSGPIAVGKTSVSDYLIEEHLFSRIRTSDYLREVASSRNIEPTRENLQNLGDDLDIQTDFSWVSNAIELSILNNPQTSSWLLDSVRKARQIEHIRCLLQGRKRILHVHLTAPESVLIARFETRLQQRNEATTYEAAVAHPNEVASRNLVECADLVLDLSTMTPAEAGQEIIKVGHAI